MVCLLPSLHCVCKGLPDSYDAGVAQLVEHELPKLGVAGSNPSSAPYTFLWPHLDSHTVQMAPTAHHLFRWPHYNVRHLPSRAGRLGTYTSLSKTVYDAC